LSTSENKNRSIINPQPITRMKPTKELRHFKNLGLPTPEADPFQWKESQRVLDIPTLQTALRHAADKFRHADTETPTEPFSALKGRVLDEGDYVFTVDFIFHDKTQAVLILDEIAEALGRKQTSGNEGDSTWSLRVGRSISIVKGDLIWMRANFLAPSRSALRQWLLDYTAWMFATDRNPAREPQPQTAEKRTADTYRFDCSLQETPRELRTTLLNIASLLPLRETSNDKGEYGEWCFSKAATKPALAKAPEPQFFIWAEDHNFETTSALIAGLEQAAKEVAGATIDYTGGGGSFAALHKLPNSGTYRFRSYLQLGSKEFCARTIRQIASEILRGVESGNIGGPQYRWSLTREGSEVSESPEAEPAPNQPETVLPATPSGGSQSPETAKNQTGAS
jgi:hypothetical protein